MSVPDRLISIDAECNGLGGQAFAVAMTLSDRSGELDHVVHRCPIDGDVYPWVSANVIPAIENIQVDCNDYPGMIFNLVETHRRWSEDGTHTVGHVVWPVEARLLLDMYAAEDAYAGPYPLLDVASVLLAKGHDPLSVDSYLRKHDVQPPDDSPHHPLYDARAAERCLRHLLDGAR